MEVILAATTTLFVLVIIIISLIGIFQTKKNKYIEAEKKFEDEISKSEMEIKEQAFKNISWELHDNVGQLLSIAKMHLNILSTSIDDQHKQGIFEASDLIGKSLTEIRSLSRTLNPEVINDMGLAKSIRVELDRFNKLKFLKAELKVVGEEQELEQKDQIIVFRILQEFFSNVIKHSQAKSLQVKLEFMPEKLLITSKDDGIGFDLDSIEKGSGLLNMKSRSELIGADFKIDTKPGYGVTLLIEYPFKK